MSAKEVSELRKSSGAGMMDCKRALAACDGDLQKAGDYLRKKGLASADKKAGRVASEGAVVSYIHGGRSDMLLLLLPTHLEAAFGGSHTVLG